MRRQTDKICGAIILSVWYQYGTYC